MDLLRESDALHARVQALARAWDRRIAAPESFDAIATDIVRHQMRYIPGVRRLIEASARASLAPDMIPAVPVDAFRLARIAAHPPELDVVRFRTSGTTSGAPGVHAMRTTETYRALCLAMGRRALFSAWDGPAVVVALAPAPGATPTSSLGFMMAAFMDEFDGRALGGEGVFDVNAPERWLFGDDGVHLAGLRRAARIASERNEPFVVLATGFALVALLDALDGATLGEEAPTRTVVMSTGGLKGRTRTIEPSELTRATARAFGVPEAHVVGEYGMTELASQLYEGTLPGGALRSARNVYVAPPWLEVTPVDPATLAPVALGDVGIARFVDLGNVDFPLAILTEDLVRRRGDGIELVGRRQGAPLRGCSLAIEEMALSPGPVAS